MSLATHQRHSGAGRNLDALPQTQHLRMLFWVPAQGRDDAKGRGLCRYGRGRCLRVVPQRSFSVARPISASTTEMIQKRTTTVDSCQPFCSK